jgi:hypothetical protein
MSSVIFHVLSTLCEHVPSVRRGLVGRFQLPYLSPHTPALARTDRYVNSVVEPSVTLP